MTATANGYTSVSTSTSFNVAESSQTLIQALNCIDAVSEGLISLTTSSTSPWLKAGNGVMSASVGKNGI